MSDSFESWWEINHRSLPVHDPKELARAVYRLFREENAVLQSQVENADINLEQSKMAMKANHGRELPRLRIHAESARKELAQRDERIKGLEARLKTINDSMDESQRIVRDFLIKKNKK